MGKKKIVTEKTQHSSTRDGSKTTRGERPSDRGALQRYGGPTGRIHRGPLDSDLVEAFKRIEWASHPGSDALKKTGSKPGSRVDAIFFSGWTIGEWQRLLNFISRRLVSTIK